MGLVQLQLFEVSILNIVLILIDIHLELLVELTSYLAACDVFLHNLCQLRTLIEGLVLAFKILLVRTLEREPRNGHPKAFSC